MMTSLRPTHHVLPPSRRSRARASFSSDRSDRSDPPSPPEDPGALLAAVPHDASHSAQETSLHPSSRAWADPERLPLLAEANESIDEPRAARRIAWRVIAATSLAVLLVTGIVLWTANIVWPWEPRSAAWASS